VNVHVQDSDEPRPAAVVAPRGGPVPLLYIAGSGRSGSTILEGMLAATSGFVAVGEMRYFWQRAVIDNSLCSCGSPFRACVFWKAVMARAFGSMDGVDAGRMLTLSLRVDRVRHIPWLTYPRLRTSAQRRAFAEYTDVLARLYRAIRDESGASVVIDSSKDAPYAFVLAAASGIRPCFLHLVRDSRGVAYSWQRVRRRPEIHWQEAYMRRFEPATAASEWNRTNLCYELLARRSALYVRVHYEDLARNPSAALVEIARRFREVDPALAALGQVGDRIPDRHSVSGNPIRFASELPPVQLDLEWQREMPRNHRRAVVLRTLPLLLRYGYLTRRRPEALGRRARS
jgi:Sulfotransferase family